MDTALLLPLVMVASKVGMPDGLGSLYVLKLRDELLLSRIPARDFDRERLAGREYVGQRRHQVRRKENTAPCSVKEHSQRGGEMNHAFDRDDEILGSTLKHRAKSVPSESTILYPDMTIESASWIKQRKA
jgi:hypothetical protein